MNNIKKINMKDISNNITDANNHITDTMKKVYNYVHNIDKFLLSNFNIINYIWYVLYLLYFIKGSNKNKKNLYTFNYYYKVYLSFILLTYFNPYSYLNDSTSIGYNINKINIDLKNICYTSGLLIFLELYDYNNYISQIKEIKNLKEKIKNITNKEKEEK
jgi:hypothetical protein